jgi:hypothetical protein
MPQQPSWDMPDWLKSIGSAERAKQAPNWFGRNVLGGAAAVSEKLPPGVGDTILAGILGPRARIPNPIKAYHGSPHDFDKFDISKIGTGEGAQTYGHGLYFAEAEPVARGYRDALTSRGRDYRANLDGQPVTIDTYGRLSNFEQQAVNSLHRSNGDVAKARQELKEFNYPEGLAEFEKMVASGRLAPSPQGHMYEVAIHATPEHFLDWDTPIGGQSPTVRAALDQAHTAATEGTSRQPWRFLRAAQQAKPESTVQDYFKLHYGDEATAKAFDQAGIPGVRYLDQVSRDPMAKHRPWVVRHPSGGLTDYPTEAQAQAFMRRYPDEGYTIQAPNPLTSNYVVWSPELIELLRKYAAPPAIAAPALATLLQQQDQQ